MYSTCYLFRWFGLERYSGKHAADLLLFAHIILLQQLLVQPIRMLYSWNGVRNLKIHVNRIGFSSSKMKTNYKLK